jgi:vancomycin resistance protein VanW
MGSILYVFRPLKASVYHKVKYGRYYFSGHAGRYAGWQPDPVRESFSHVWSEVRIAIRRRGPSPDVDANRIWNMQLAAGFFDGLVVHPGEVVGFWQRVPAPRARNRFRPGPTLIRKSMTSDFGGGLCQISTALFKVFLRAGFQVIERHSHSIDAYGADRYFVLGQDAAVAYGYKDLVVRNTNAEAVQLRMQIDSEHPVVAVSIRSTDPLPFRSRLETHILEGLHLADRPGKAGWRVETIRRRFGPAIGGGEEGLIDYRMIDTYQPHSPLSD